MKKTLPILLLVLFVSFFENIYCTNTRPDSASNTQTPVLKKQLKIIILGESNAEKTDFVSALTFYLSGKGIGAYFSKKGILSQKKNYKINNENIEFCEVLISNNDVDYLIYVNDDPEVSSKFLTSRQINFDAAIILVTHTDGTMPYTFKHMKQSNDAGIKNLFCFVTKSELVEDQEVSDMIKKDIITLIDSTHNNVTDTKIVFGSAQVDLLKKNPNWMDQMKMAADFLLGLN